MTIEVERIAADLLMSAIQKDAVAHILTKSSNSTPEGIAKQIAAMYEVIHGSVTRMQKARVER
jgi:phospholipase/lecithinase/hemolysin